MTITAAQKYKLNNMNRCAKDVQLGTLIENAESVTAGEIALADAKILVGNASGVGAACTPGGEVTMDRTGAFTIGVIANLKTKDETTAAYNLEIASNGDGGTPLTANKKLSIDVYNADRTIDLQGNLNFGGNVALTGGLTLTGAWTQTGAHTVGITTTGNTTITLPTSGTLMTSATATVWTDSQTLDNAKQLKFRELTSNGTNYIGFRAPDALAGDKDYILPATDAAGVMKSDGSGNLSWYALTFSGTDSIALTTAGATTLTLPTTGTLATLAGAEVLENKTMEATCKVVDTTDNTKVLGFDLSGMTAGKTITLTPISDVNNIVKINLTGSTTGKYLSLASAITDDRVVTIQDGTHTLAKTSGDSFDDIVALKLRDVTTAAQTLELKSDSTTVLTADRALTIDVVNADRNVEVGGDVVFSSDFKVADQVLYASGQLSQANLVAMNGSPVTLIAACAAGKSIVVDEIEFFHDYSTAAYTGGGDVSVEYSGGTDICLFDATLVTAGADDYRIARPTIYDLDASTGTAIGFDFDAVDNSGIQITNASGAFADGNASNILKWRIKYRIITRLT